MNSVPMRSPSIVMQLPRLGAFHQSRLSFSRRLLRRLSDERWTFTRRVWQLDERGVGIAVICAHGPERTYSLVCFAHDLDPKDRSDRSIAVQWDATFALFDGIPTNEDLKRLSDSIPRQEAGRFHQSELSISRANRSVRLFEYVCTCLADGRQPDMNQVSTIGYLMRTTAVYGSGKFGAAAYATIATRPEFAAPFQVEMLSVYLIRQFSIDLVEHIARMKNPATAVPLAPELSRSLGVGNATGLGMAPFLINHPELISNWIKAREEALSRVRSIGNASEEQLVHFRTLLTRTGELVNQWRSKHALQRERIRVLERDIETLSSYFDEHRSAIAMPWDRLFRWSERNLSLEGQELLASLIIEQHGSLVDDLAESMASADHVDRTIDGAMTVTELQAMLDAHFDWARQYDFDLPDSRSRYWYVSENKLEPRLGMRSENPKVDQHESPLAVASDCAALDNELKSAPADQSVALFLLRHPEHRHMIRRVQTLADYPYAEIRENLLSNSFLPIDLLRCKLSFFGATKFDPQSDRWVRIILFQNAPIPNELSEQDKDDWIYPSVPMPA